MEKMVNNKIKGLKQRAEEMFEKLTELQLESIGSTEDIERINSAQYCLGKINGELQAYMTILEHLKGAKK